MKKAIVSGITAALLCTFLWQGQLRSQSPPARFNVKYYGVKGDGKTDDTEALQKAFDEAAKTGVGELFFPQGNYIISKPVVPRVSMRGPATIWGKNPDQDILYSEYAHHISFTHLVFRGGRTALNLANPNIDTGFIQITDCKFFDTHGPAVRVREGSNSTFTLIRRSQFINCAQVLITYTDWTTMKDCWLSGSAEQGNRAMIENRSGKMVLEDIVGVPNVTDTDQRWIDNYGGLTVKDFRFGGETAGFTPIVNFAKYSTQLGGPRIIVEDSPIFALGNNKRACAVYCEEIPNMIEIRNCTIGGVPAIKFRKDIDLKNYFKNVRPGMLQFNLVNNIGEFAGEIPELLKNPVIIQEEAAKVFQLSEADTKKALAEAVKAQLGRPRTDETPAERTLMETPYTGKKQAVAPSSDYIDITFDKYHWDLDDYMDGTSEKNSKYLAIAPAGDDVIIMRRIKPKTNWPHVLIRNVKIDLDKYPLLTWRVKDPGDTGKTTAFSYAIKAVDKETEEMLVAVDHYHGHDAFFYGAFNLKENFKKAGVRTFDIRFYYLATKYLRPPTDDDPGVIYTEPGGYMVLDFLRAEAE